MINVSYQTVAMEYFGLQLRNVAGVSGVSIRSGRRAVDYGNTSGPPTSTWSLGTGLVVEVWGEDSALVSGLMELARLVDHRDQEIDDLAEALTQANDRQLRLFELSRLSMESLDSTLTIQRVLQHGIGLTNSTLATFAFATGNCSTVSPNEGTCAEWIESTTRAALVDGNLRKSVGPTGTQVLIAPVVVGESCHAIALGRHDTVPFGTAERKVIDALAGSLGAALRLVEMHESALHQAITESEHSMAAELANTVLPKFVSSVPGIDAFATCLPARSVGGDFFTSASYGGALRFVIGDVAGKGLPAAVLMTNAITVANAIFRNDETDDAMQLLASIHDSLESLLLGTHRFITMVVGIATVDHERPGTVRLSLANAGHSPVLVCVGGQIQAVPPCSPPVGVGVRPSGSGFNVELSGHDSLVTGSDGLLEQDGDRGHMFGQQRLEALLHGNISAAAMAERILAAVQQFGGALPRSDDQTVFVLRPDGGLMNSDNNTLLGPNAATATSIMDIARLADGRPRLRIDADLFAVRGLATWIPDSIHALAGEAANDIVGPAELAIHELCINITEHAYAGQVGPIDLSVTNQGSELVFELFDAGGEFDPALIAEPDPDRPTVRGYGMMIVHALASRVDYKRNGDLNHWIVGFEVPGRSAQSSSFPSSPHSAQSAPPKGPSS